MYFWRIEKLKGEMAARPLSEREALPYLVASVGLWSAVGYIPQTIANFWDGLGAVWSVILAIVATIYIYRKNGGAGGNHFLQRYLAISWVVGIRCTSIIIFSYFVLTETLSTVGIENHDFAWYDFVFMAIAEAVLYMRIGHHVEDLAVRAKSMPNSTSDKPVSD